MVARLFTVLLVSMPSGATAQIGRSVEVVGTVAAVGGATRVNTARGIITKEHVGIRLDAGLQFPARSYVAGARIWGLNDNGADKAVEGAGLDLFIGVSQRLGSSLRSAVRGTLGLGVDKVNEVGGSDASYEGVAMSLGAEREFIVFTKRIVLSADLILPPAAPGGVGRRGPVIELGLGARGRAFQRIAPI